MYTLVLSTGSNLGNRQENLENASELIRGILGHIRQYSAIYESSAWGYFSENIFYNQCLEVQTELSPEECLQQILAIEMRMGRKRRGKAYNDRIIDIDILFYDDLVMDQDQLKIPHGRLQERKFVLLPLAEILPEFQHPVYHKSIRELLELCSDTLDVHLIVQD
ncbi:2-amino-4-hydroxy-6-hydroxymethyldihydropteridine diphosphokinase [Bacteroidota bacterium]